VQNFIAQENIRFMVFENRSNSRTGDSAIITSPTSVVETSRRWANRAAPGIQFHPPGEYIYQLDQNLTSIVTDFSPIIIPRFGMTSHQVCCWLRLRMQKGQTFELTAPADNCCSRPEV
jgi:hypothetical protein